MSENDRLALLVAEAARQVQEIGRARRKMGAQWPVSHDPIFARHRAHDKRLQELHDRAAERLDRRREALEEATGKNTLYAAMLRGRYELPKTGVDYARVPAKQSA